MLMILTNKLKIRSLLFLSTNSIPNSLYQQGVKAVNVGTVVPNHVDRWLEAARYLTMYIIICTVRIVLQFTFEKKRNEDLNLATLLDSTGR